MPLVEIRRADFSQSLVHLTREKSIATAGANGETVVKTVSPFAVLKEILAGGVIRGSGNEGFVKGTQRAVCFSELAAVAQFAGRPDEPNARYRFYGIAVSKRAAFELGGRPVIYLPDNDGHWIPPEQKWRHVRFEWEVVDFTHEREWRVAGDLDLRKTPGFYVLVWNPVEAKEIYDMASPVANLLRGVLPMEHLTQML